MTGQGQAVSQNDEYTVSAEVRAVNGRYLKLNFRASEGYSTLERLVDPLVKESVRRGTVNVNLQINRVVNSDDYQLNEALIGSYLAQAERLRVQHPTATLSLGEILQLPGAVEESRSTAEADDCWPVVEAALRKALSQFNEMREVEGQAMFRDMHQNCQTIEQILEHIVARAPQVVEAYRTRLTDRLNKLLAEHDVSVEPSEVVREVGIFADRCDISEEQVRLRSHLEQFVKIMDGDESNGRKLDFMIQEMFRETNTIGSKANDAEIARHVVDIKTVIERMREMVQNVE